MAIRIDRYIFGKANFNHNQIYKALIKQNQILNYKNYISYIRYKAAIKLKKAI